MLQLKLVCDDCGEELHGDPTHPYRYGDGPRMHQEARDAGWTTPYSTGPQMAYCPACTPAFQNRIHLKLI